VKPDAADRTDAAARLVTSVAPRRPVREELEAAGLEVLGPCVRLAQRRDLLMESALLQDFTADEVDALGSVMLHVRARPGQLLIREDDKSDWMMLLLSGTVDVGKRPVGATSQAPVQSEAARLAVLRAGAVLGEMSMLDGEPRFASCWALGDVEAAVLTREGVARLIAEQPGVGAKLLVKITQLLAQRLRNTSHQLMRHIKGER
jgi:CRP/FNR family transcriptional regulator, cyclic AMP receptor protein